MPTSPFAMTHAHPEGALTMGAHYDAHDAADELTGSGLRPGSQWEPSRVGIRIELWAECPVEPDECTA